MSGTKLSIIIPTLNEEGNLGQCIKYLAIQTMQDFEVIIVDGGSADQTIDIAEENGFTVLIVEKTRPHDVSTAKNLGAKHAIGDILFFFDADMILEPNCLEVLSEGYEASDVVGIALKVLPSEANRFEKAMYECNNYLAWIGNKIGVHEISYFSCHSYRRDAFMWVGGIQDGSPRMRGPRPVPQVAPPGKVHRHPEDGHLDLPPEA